MSRMHLYSVALAGYKSYNDGLIKNKIKLKDINVIVDANGTGKNDLISFLNMIRFMMVRGLMTFVLKQGDAQTFLHSNSQTNQIQGELVIRDLSKSDITYVFNLKENELNQLSFSQEYMLYPINDHKILFKKDFGVNHLESNLADSMELIDYELRRCLTQIDIFHFNNTSINSRICSTTHRDNDLHLFSDGRNIAAILYRMMRNPNTRIYYARILRYIRMVFPQFSEFVLKSDLNRKIQLNWKQTGSNQIFDAYQLSDEILRFIILTTILLQPTKTAPMLIVLDEPENGLHSHALDVLTQEIRMASKVSQIIFTTQSPVLLNHFSQENIVTIDYDYNCQCSIFK